MLKLERHQHQSDIHVRLRDREPFLSRSFLSALAIAVGLHAVGLLIFQVSPFRFHVSETIFAPIEVQTTLGNGDHALAEVKDEVVVVPDWLQHTYSKPTLPKIAVSSIAVHIPTHVPPASHPVSGSTPPHWLKVSGPLAERRLVTPEIDHALQVAYNIRVDNTTGEIIWHNPLEYYPPETRERAEAFLNAIRFETDDTVYVTQGQIEVLRQ